MHPYQNTSSHYKWTCECLMSSNNSYKTAIGSSWCWWDYSHLNGFSGSLTCHRIENQVVSKGCLLPCVHRTVLLFCSPREQPKAWDTSVLIKAGEGLWNRHLLVGQGSRGWWEVTLYAFHTQMEVFLPKSLQAFFYIVSSSAPSKGTFIIWQSSVEASTAGGYKRSEVWRRSQVL